MTGRSSSSRSANICSTASFSRAASRGVGSRPRASKQGAQSSASGGGGRLPRGIPALGTVILHPRGPLPQGDYREQAPQTIPADQLQFPLLVAAEEALVRRLDDVLGIDLALQRATEALVGQGD